MLEVVFTRETFLMRISAVPLIRYAIVLAAAKGDAAEAHEIALNRYGAGDQVAVLTKAAASAGTTVGADWGSALVSLRNAGMDFAEMLRPRSVLARMRQDMRRIPFNTRTSSATSGSGAAWVGEGQPIPVSSPVFSELVNLPAFKIAALVVQTSELIRLATTLGNEGIVSRDMVAAVAEAQDRAFLSDAAATANSPAGILNGISPLASSGSTIADITSDLERLFTELTDAGNLLQAPYLVTSPKIAVQLALKHSSDGSPAFPSVGVAGGELGGVPLLVSNVVPSDSTGSSIVLIDASEVLISDEDLTEVSASAHALIRMDDTPSTDVNTYSMWQQNSVAIKAVRHVNWKARRPQVAAFVNGVNYSSVTS